MYKNKKNEKTKTGLPIFPLFIFIYVNFKYRLRNAKDVLLIEIFQINTTLNK